MGSSDYPFVRLPAETLDYQALSKEERAKLMMDNYHLYSEIVPEEHWLQLLDALARFRRAERKAKGNN